MKKLIASSVVALGLLTAACGGGGGGSDVTAAACEKQDKRFTIAYDEFVEAVEDANLNLQKDIDDVSSMGDVLLQLGDEIIEDCDPSADEQARFEKIEGLVKQIQAL